MTVWQCIDGVEGMRSLPPSSVRLVVTSPPYGPLRTFGGHRFDWAKFKGLARELFRVLDEGGILCWQEGDYVVDGGYRGDPYRHALYLQDVVGFVRHDTLITGQESEWKHPPARYGSPPQYLFVFSKGRPDPARIHLLRDKPNKSAGQPAGRKYRQKDGTIRRTKTWIIGEYGVRSATREWLYPSASHTEKPYQDVPHGGTMHQLLARDLIKSYSNPGDLVLDPMGGLATTGKWSLLLGRRFTGYELHYPYWEWGRRRLREARFQQLEILKAITRHEHGPLH